MMQAMDKITEKEAFEQDVKTMSYDELMASIRYLDSERQIIAKRVEPKFFSDKQENIKINHKNS